MLEILSDIIYQTWLVTAQMGLWLLFGFLVAGLLSVFISPAWLERHLGGRGMGPVWRASIFGVPLPLCSCGVIPVAASLKQHGASRSATTAFLLSTPQTGVDSILVTWTLLGPLFAVFRPLVALLTGVLGGGLVQTFDPPAPVSEAQAAQAAARTGDQPLRPQGLAAKLRACFSYGFLTLPADIGRALLIGLIIAGVLGALIPADFLSRFLGAGPLSIALMMIVGIPIYVCATASVPLAATFIFLGATPGAALAFLIAGPATNAATITTVGRVLGRKTAVLYLVTVAISAFGGGLLLDWLMPRAGEWIPLFAEGGHDHHGVGWIDHLGGALLALVMTASWWQARRQGCGCDSECASEKAGGSGAMEEADSILEFTIEGMSCSHCSGSVDRVVRALPGVRNCTVFLKEGRLMVERSVDGSTDAQDAIVAAVQGLGYQIQRR
jgi:uncharacterized protein